VADNIFDIIKNIDTLSDSTKGWTKEKIIDSAYSKISSLKATVGGYWGNTYEVNIDLINSKATWTVNMGLDAGESHHLTFNTQAKEKFLSLLKRSKLLEWQDSYVDPGILDGTQWSVRIILEGEELYKYGSNEYPKKWDTFCISVKELVDREFQ